MIGAGRLDRRITIERATVAANEFNEPVQTWAALTTIWAAREDVTAQEKDAAGERGAALMARFRVRSTSVTRTVTPDDRINHDGAIWNITEVSETRDGRRRFLWIRAVRRAV